MFNRKCAANSLYLGLIAFQKRSTTPFIWTRLMRDPSHARAERMTAIHTSHVSLTIPITIPSYRVLLQPCTAARHGPRPPPAYLLAVLPRRLPLPHEMLTMADGRAPPPATQDPNIPRRRAPAVMSHRPHPPSSATCCQVALSSTTLRGCSAHMLLSSSRSGS